MENETNHSSGTIHQQNGCEWLGNNVVMVIPLIILELRVGKWAEKPAEEYIFTRREENFYSHSLSRSEINGSVS